MELDVFHLFLWEPIAFAGTPFELNRVVLLMYLAAAITIGFFLLGARKQARVPKGIQFYAETGYLFVRNNIAIDVIGPAGAKYAPFLASLFFFIFFSNLLEIIPFISFPVTSRMALPAILALASWVVFNAVGIRKQGLRYFKDTLFPPGVPGAIKPLLALIELFSVFLIRPLTLALRLFANMLAGHVLLTIFFLFTEELLLHAPIYGKPLGLVTFLVAILLVVFEFMVITIQAYIFTTLTAFYIAESLHGHGEEEHAEHEAHDKQPEAIRETELAPA
ncbi:MAG: F0F1 ATP synthase subunit A [Actinomycetota bacterium]|jgi:F-type H+-transporting ATPase subunit a|nr:F0F1 ATP synthase subunit A [Actinomycetota bacterium]